MSRRWTAALVAAVAATVGGLAYAAIPDDDGTYHACMLKSLGTIRIIDPARQRCSAVHESEITFAKQGPPGDAGPPGPPGADGQDGAAFSGMFTSPNGEYTLAVTDSGIVLSGSAATIDLSADGISITSAGDPVTIDGKTLNLVSQQATSLAAGTELTAQTGSGATLAVGSSLSLQTGSGINVDAGGSLSVQAASAVAIAAGTSLVAQAGGAVVVDAAGGLSLRGSTVSVNPGGSCRPAARLGDAVTGTAPPGGGAIAALIGAGSSAVCIG